MILKISAYELASIIIAGLTLIATISIPCTLSHLERKKDKKNEEINAYNNAREFILKNNDEIDFLPLCVIANCMKNIKCNRKIFNNFILLDDLTKQKVLEMKNIDMKLIENDDWIETKLNEVRNIIKEYELGKDYLYDNFKYFHGAFKKYSKIKLDNYNHFYTQRMFQNLLNGDHKAFGNNLPFGVYAFDYLEAIINEKEMNTNVIKPIDYLDNILQLGNQNEEFIDFIIMMIVDTVLIVSINLLNYNLDNREYLTDNNETFEDMYLTILFKLYNWTKEKNK